MKFAVFATLGAISSTPFALADWPDCSLNNQQFENGKLYVFPTVFVDCPAFWS
jgi:hypothetical protein